MPKKSGVKKPKKLTKEQMLKMMHGQGFFGDLWSGIKSAIKKPSTWLGAAGMLPTPLAPALKLGSVVSGLTGNGRRKVRRGGARPKSTVIRM